MSEIAQGVSNSNSVSGDDNDTDASYQNPSAVVGKLPGRSFACEGFWSQPNDDMNYNQMQEFWCKLYSQDRQKLLRIDKQTLCERARKNMHCSRCHGLLVDVFSQIVMYGKSLQQVAAVSPYSVKAADCQNNADSCTTNGCQSNGRDPSVHPWGGLASTRDGMLTLLDCYLYSKSLEDLQNVFDSARARERDRELLYPDACGGGGRGWMSQGVAGYSRGHGTRETCALHTARLSVETLVDFWSALGGETRQSLLKMKEDDFIDLLTYRFESKRFCRDCRRNVIREFKELKELKRMRKETRCTSWFCAPDTAFQYEVSLDTVQVDWHQTFSDSFEKYHHFEWAIGSGERKSDILEFENVGLSGKVQVNGLDLSELNACYITLRALRMDGRCNELCVKAHALRGQQCVHCRLVIGDGFITITRGESITRFFEHAEEADEEEDDDSMDKDGNDLDGECSRPQKHAKSPELAREFLLDAATVIFKEHIEKAFREGTARQNAHRIFVFLALKLLEERLHVAFKEIVTTEKQMKLLEEEEKEKREDEERKERKRTKEREKKLRRKERLREKENREMKSIEMDLNPIVVKEESTPSVDLVDQGVNDVPSRDSSDERGEATQSSPLSPDIQDTYSNIENPSEDIPDEELSNTRDWNTSFSYRNHKQLRTNSGRPNLNRYGSKTSEKCQCADNRITGDRCNSHSCSRSHHLPEYRSRSESHITRVSPPDTSKFYHRGQPKSNTISGNTPKQVWEPLDSQKKCIRRNSDSDFTLRSTLKVEPQHPECCSTSSDEVTDTSIQKNHEDHDRRGLTGSMAKPQNSSRSSSKSDTFSSCLSEGDSNLYSKSQNAESTSNSDSEESTQILDEKETSNHIKSTECSNSLKEAASYCEKGVASISIGAQPHSVIPQMHSNRGINYPVFQAPTMGYYHPNPVSWPVNELAPFTHSKHYLFPLNGKEQFVQYGALQYQAPPSINHTHAPVLQPDSQVNEVSTNATGLKEAGCCKPKVPSTDQSGTPKVVDDKMDMGNNGFSLFHFGGFLSTGITEDMKKSLANCDHPCGKKDAVEYNLFDATNGLRFSIF